MLTKRQAAILREMHDTDEELVRDSGGIYLEVTAALRAGKPVLVRGDRLVELP